MNYTSLDEAYKICHVSPNTYTGTLHYKHTCIYCKYPVSTPLMKDRDGGSFRRCDKCNKNFRATIINPAIDNFSNSTHHLKGTN
jgi:hypothetical protein